MIIFEYYHDTVMIIFEYYHDTIMLEKLYFCSMDWKPKCVQGHKDPLASILPISLFNLRL